MSSTRALVIGGGIAAPATAIAAIPSMPPLRTWYAARIIVIGDASHARLHVQAGRVVAIEDAVMAAELPARPLRASANGVRPLPGGALPAGQGSPRS